MEKKQCGGHIENVRRFFIMAMRKMHAFMRAFDDC